MRFRLRTRVPHPASTNALALSADGRLVATTSFDQKLRVYDAATLALVKSLHLGTAFPHAACFSPDGSRVGSGGKAITFFDTATWKKRLTLKGHRHEVQDAACSPDGASVYTGSGNHYTPADWSVRAWDADSGVERWRWKAATSVYALAVSPDGATVAAGDRDGRVTLLDAASGAVRWAVETAAWVYRLRFTPSGDAVVASGDADALTVLDARSGEPRTLAIGAGSRAFVLSRDGATAIVARSSRGTSQTLIAVDLATGATRWEGEPLGYLPQGLELAPDEQALYVLMYDPNELVVYDRDG